jgi:hypothetical protein
VFSPAASAAVSGSCIKVAALGCWLPSFKAIEMKNLSIAATLACLLVGYGGYTICDAKVADPGLVPPEDPNVEAVARVLVNELSAPRLEVRDKAATALQTMGTNAAKALADYIENNLKNVKEIQGITKAVTVLGKIGKDLADDDDVRGALLRAARLDETNWPNLQLRLAAMDALGEINKYRGGIFGKESSYPSSADEYADPSGSVDLDKVIEASDKVAGIAGGVFEKLANGGRPAATPAPTPAPTTTPSPTPLPPPVKTDGDFYGCFLVLDNSQVKLVKLATQVKAAASGSNKKTTDAALSKLTDAETLAASLRKIEVGYLDATKTGFADSPAQQADDKSRWQLKTEAAYNLLTETRRLSYQLHSLETALDNGRDDLREVITGLQEVSDVALKQSGCRDKAATAQTPECALLGAAANALNAIFSKPPEEKPAEELAKKEPAKKEAKASDKKDDTRKDADKEGNGKE